MTAIDTTQFSDPPLGHLGIIGRIGKLAMPLMVGSLAAAGLQVVKAGILTYNGEEAALYSLSLVQPAFIFMLAFLEALAITNQVFSSKSVTNWAKGDVLRATRVFSVIGLVLTALLVAGFYGASFAVAGRWPDAAPVLPQMGLFVLSMAPYLLFELRNGALRGQGKTAKALIPFAVLIVADVVATWVAVAELGMGFHGVLIGNAAGPLIALPLVTLMLRREIGDAPRGEAGDFKKHMIGLTIGVAGPVFVSMFAGSASAAVIFPTLATLGSDVASGFLVIVRLRILFIIPAIAVGSAIAILINQMPEQGHASEKRGILSVGVTTVLGIYALATFGIYVMRAQVVGLVVPAENAALFAATLDLMMVLIVTFFLVAAFTMLQVILEHLGMGVRVLVVTIATELATIGLVFAVLARGYGLDGVLQTMNVIAVATFVLLGAVFVGYVRKMGRSDAV
ncbi:hypothetical protein [Tropicibacter oceani]|uniref:Multidrug resistance protein NorM n=1 Tax=Tropicibacter oceani TaxID=3058420 RepID=A0ABY8QJ08_9RHOB|nr:hypothetical protein [Tropicibacter oceani]WGW04524.1 hypothetical protein QF118_02945 [Tropicibacter oceani]